MITHTPKNTRDRVAAEKVCLCYVWLVFVACVRDNTCMYFLSKVSLLGAGVQ